jgi:predicted O-methyltransferase YrrM
MKSPPLKLDVAIFNFAYGSNGGCASEHPDIREWQIETILKMKQDPRIGNITMKTLSDTPVTLTRNRAVRIARELGAELVLFIDSDQSPNKHKGEPWFKPFWDVAFEHAYDHYPKGPVCIGAPYCGPPPHENIYVFQFGSFATGHGDETRISLDQYSRAQASQMTGIQECAALPTGLILFDIRCFDLIEPSPLPKQTILERVQAGRLTIDDAMWALRDGYFYYEWADQRADQKASTEDVTCTRDIALAGQAVLGYNPVRCAWDSWIGHWKPWNVGKPMKYGIDEIAANFQKAVLDRHSNRDKIIEAGQFAKIPPSKKHPEPIVIPPRWQETHETPADDINALTTLVRQVLAEKDECRVLEVGTWLGDTAIAMAEAGANVTCVDTWEGTANDTTGKLAKIAGPDGVYNEFLSRIGDKAQRSIFPRRATSQEAATWGWPNDFDIIFLDADHSYEALKADIEAWLPHLAVDGIICGHDYNAQDFPGVKKAVMERFGTHPGLNVIGRTIWAVIPALEPA